MEKIRNDKKLGQGMVEFALVLPLMLLLMMGIIEFGRLLFTYGMVSSSSREAARYGSAVGDVGNYVPHYQDCNGIRAAAQRLGSMAGVTDGDVFISYDHGPNTTVFASACPVPVGEPVRLGDRVVVRVVATYRPIVPLVNLPAFPVTATTRRTIIKDVRIKGTPEPPFPTNTPEAPPDDLGPLTTNLVAIPNPVQAGEPITIHAVIDDSSTGGSTIASAVFSLDGAMGALQADDGNFDQVSENVSASVTAPGLPGIYDLCASGTDAPGNPGPSECIQLEVLDEVGPVTSNLVIFPNPVENGLTISISALIDDSTTGGSTIKSGEYSLDGGGSWLPIPAQDGGFDEVSEAVSVSVTAPSVGGSITVCVRGTDARDNLGSAECTQLQIVQLGPLTTNLEVIPNPVDSGQELTINAIIDDSTTGGSTIASGVYSLDGGVTWLAIPAVDGSYDEISEPVSVSVTAPDQVGIIPVCVRGTDAAGNIGDPVCVDVEVVQEGPLTSNLVAAPDPVVIGQTITITAMIDDSTTGGSTIAYGEYSLDDGATWAQIQPQDGSFDGVSEAVHAFPIAPDVVGSINLCVRGTDAAGYTGPAECTQITPTPICYGISANFQPPSGTKFELQLQNNSDHDIIVEEIFFQWPPDDKQYLNSIQMNGGVIWDTGDDVTPTWVLPAQWVAGTDLIRTVLAHSTSIMQFTFKKNAANTGYNISVTFSNQCTRNASR